MNDSRVYLELFDSPKIFLNYLYQRSLASNNPHIKVNDELDHIGLYFEHNDYAGHISDLVEETDATDIFISSYRGDIDTYMARMLNKKFEDKDSNFFLDAFIGLFAKPEQKMDAMFRQVIMLLDNTKDVQCIRAARYLLLLISKNCNQINNFLSTRAQKLLEFKECPTFLHPYSAHNYKKEDRIDELPIIMIFLLNASNKLFKNVVERKHFLMERVLYEAELPFCILSGMDRNKKIKKADSQIIVPEQFQQISESTYNLLKNARKK